MEGKMYINITHITGINNSHAEQLQDAGIFSVDDLVESTRPENLKETIRKSGVWRSALLGYGVLARAILNAENDFYKRVSGGYLLFVEDANEEEGQEENEPGDQSLPWLYGFQVVDSPDHARLFARRTRYHNEASGAGIFVPPGRWIR